MIFWLILILFIGSVICGCCFYGFDSILNILYSSVFGLLLTISLFTIIINHSTKDAYIESDKHRYEALCYKLESENVRDEFGLFNKEIVDEIQCWNEDLAKYKALEKNFWVGIYIPNISDHFEYIEYK